MSDIDDIFKVHRLNAKGIGAAVHIAEAFTLLLRTVENLAGPAAPRDLAIVRTKLQEASFFAKRAMATNPDNQETP